jgi:hypothetical protein
MKKPSLKKIKPRIPKNLPMPLRRQKGTEERVEEALRGVPRITNETVAEHREAVLSSARKYIYPLKHSKHRVVRTSISIIIVAVIVFMAYCGFALYKLQSTSGFIYDITKVIPFPVARVGSNWVSYESYLFELRRNMHYYESQQNVDFGDKQGKAQLALLKKEALSQVEDNDFVSQLAREHNVTVSGQAINNEVLLLRDENRLGSSNRDFNEVLSEFWGWDQADFKRELGEEMLQQAVVAKLDTADATKANGILVQLQKGADFGTLAAQYSDDSVTKTNGGQYANAITPADTDLAPAITAELFKLQAGQLSGVVNTGYTLEMLKVVDRNGDSLHAAHIQINLASIQTYIKPLQQREREHAYIKF